MPLRIEIGEVDNITIMTLVGALVVDTHRSLSDHVNQLLARGKKTVLFNLEGIATIDSAGIGCLIGAYIKVRKAVRQ
jgi:anti-anti-sigma factor